MQMTKASGRVGLDAGADRLHHLEIDAEQVVAAHAGLARHAGGDDDHVGAGDRCVGARAGELGVEAFDRAGFGEIERLALRHAVDDVEQDDVAEFLQPRPDGPSVPPIWPAPIRAIFFRAMEFSRFRDVAAVDGAARQNRAVYRPNAPGRSSLTFGADARG